MLDTIIVGAVVAIAAFFMGRRLLRTFHSRQSTCGCTGCGQSCSCSGTQGGPGNRDCNGPR